MGRSDAGYLVASFAASVRRACELAQIPRSTYRHERDVGRDQTLRERLVVLAQEKPRYGYRRLHVLLEREGESVNHKRLFRVYRAAGLSVKRRKRKRLLRQGRPQEVLTRANQQWVVDFVHDRLNDGRSFRIFSVVDGYTRECLALEADTSFASQRVSRVLDDVIAERTKPETIRMDNELNASSNLQRGDSIPGDRPEGRQVVHGAVFDAAGAVVFHDEKRPRSS